MSVQSVNLAKLKALQSARAIGPPQFDVSLTNTKIKSVDEFKYLDYWLPPKTGWSND
jgi:hypothetical protein